MPRMPRPHGYKSISPGSPALPTGSPDVVVRASMPERSDESGDGVGRGDSIEARRSAPPPELERAGLLDDTAVAATVADRGRRCCGEPEGGQLLSLGTQWAIVAVIAALLAYLLVESRADPLVGALSATEAFYLLDVAVPLALVALGYALMFSFAGGLPPVKLVALGALLASICAVAHAAGVIVPWLVASCAAVILPFWLVALARPAGQGEDARLNYGSYTFLAPCYLPFVYAAAFYVVRVFDLDPAMRWKIAVVGGSALPIVVNFLYGERPSVQKHLRYWAGQLCLYTFVFKGVCQWLELALQSTLQPHVQHVFKVLNTTMNLTQTEAVEIELELAEMEATLALLIAQTSARSQQEQNYTIAAVLNGSGCAEVAGAVAFDVDVYSSWQVWVAWGFTACWLCFNQIKYNVPCGVIQELCCSCSGCPFAPKRLRQTTDCDDKNQPMKSAGLFRWTYWSLGLVIGTLFLACSLPEILLGAGYTHGFFLWWKAILGFGMILVHSSMMGGRTVSGNAAYLQGARGQPNLTDVKWRKMKTICQIVQLIHWTAMGYYFYSHDYHHHPNYPIGRPDILKALDASAIGLLAAVNVTRACIWALEFNHLFWIVRDKKEAGENDMETTEPYGRWEPFIRLFAEPHADTSRLAERLNHRRGSAATVVPSWLQDQMLSRTSVLGAELSTGTKPMRSLQQAEVMEESFRILAHPKTLQVDNHTLLFMFLANFAVKGGRTSCMLISDVKKPFRKQKLRTLLSLVADIEFAYSDEFYSRDEDHLEIDHNYLIDTVLNLVSALKMIDKPRWFDSELEAVVLLESSLRDMLPPGLSESWPEMSSDQAMSTLVFCGVGQLYLLSRSAWEKQRAFGLPPSDRLQRRKFYAEMKGTGVVECELPSGVEVPEETAFVLDLTTMAKYAVREGFACYGGCAFFAKDKRLLAIYNCQSRRLLTAPSYHSLEWENAKFTIKASIISMATLREHLMYCHWIVSNRCGISSREELHADHPVRRILALFTFRSGSINFTSTITLMQENMLLHRASPLEQHGVLDAFEDMAATWRFQTFPEMAAAKEIPEEDGDDVSLPYLEDGTACWAVFHRFFTSYIDLYYGEGEAGDRAVQNDPEIQAYWGSLERVSSVRWQPEEPGQEYARPGELMGAIEGEGRSFVGKFNGYGLPNALCDKAAIINQLTHTAFWVCGMHEFAGNIVEYFESPNFCATKVYANGPNGPNTQTQADVQTFLQNLCVVGSTGYKLPDLVSDWKSLLLEDDCGADERFAGKRKAVEALHDNFMRELVDLGEAIEERNAGPRAQGLHGREFMSFDPRTFECSVSI